MGKKLDLYDLEGARDRVIEAAEKADAAYFGDGFSDDEMGRLGDALIWLRVVEGNVSRSGRGESPGAGGA